jgi:hypothetical protein
VSCAIYHPCLLLHLLLCCVRMKWRRLDHRLTAA